MTGKAEIHGAGERQDRRRYEGIHHLIPIYCDILCQPSEDKCKVMRDWRGQQTTCHGKIPHRICGIKEIVRLETVVSFSADTFAATHRGVFRTESDRSRYEL